MWEAHRIKLKTTRNAIDNNNNCLCTVFVYTTDRDQNEDDRSMDDDRKSLQTRRNFIFQSKPFLATNCKTSSCCGFLLLLLLPHLLLHLIIMAVLHSIDRDVQHNDDARPQINKYAIECPNRRCIDEESQDGNVFDFLLPCHFLSLFHILYTLSDCAFVVLPKKIAAKLLNRFLVRVDGIFLKLGQDSHASLLSKYGGIIA